MTKEITTKPTVPTLEELYDDVGAIVKQNKLNIILNAPPKAEWVRMHPFVKNLKYLPIERVEYLLTMIFSKWRIEVKEVKLLANSIQVTIRLHVLDPITGEWDWQDGVGAMPIQVSKGSGATEFDKMNSSAVQIGLPAAESFAIKDAAEKFGRIFGKDLNRKDNISYDRLYSVIQMNEIMNNPSLTEDVRNEVKDTKTLEELVAVHQKYEGMGKEFDALVVEQKKLLQANQKENANS